jgi:hypothetical protein
MVSFIKLLPSTIKGVSPVIDPLDCAKLKSVGHIGVCVMLYEGVKGVGGSVVMGDVSRVLTWRSFEGQGA